jgi:hypothetical protein
MQNSMNVVGSFADLMGGTLPQQVQLADVFAPVDGSGHPYGNGAPMCGIQEQLLPQGQNPIAQAITAAIQGLMTPEAMTDNIVVVAAQPEFGAPLMGEELLQVIRENQNFPT